MMVTIAQNEVATLTEQQALLFENEHLYDKH